VEALRQAQVAMLRGRKGRTSLVREDHPADKDKRLPPYYWAAFVLSGDWG
jgi:CHAT domain-containing protein